MIRHFQSNKKFGVVNLMTDYKVPFAYKSALLTILQFLVSEGKPAVKKKKLWGSISVVLSMDITTNQTWNGQHRGQRKRENWWWWWWFRRGSPQGCIVESWRSTSNAWSSGWSYVIRYTSCTRYNNTWRGSWGFHEYIYVVKVDTTDSVMLITT